MNSFYKYLISFFLIISNYTLYNIYKNENYNIVSLYCSYLILFLKYIIQIFIIGFGYILYNYYDTEELGKVILLAYFTYKFYIFNIPLFIFTGLHLFSIIFPKKNNNIEYNIRRRSRSPPPRRHSINN